MKKLNLCWMLIALMGIFASCSKDDLQNATTAGAEGMTFTVGTDFGTQTRAIAPTIPPGRKLRYVMEVYTQNGKVGSQTVKYASSASEQVSFIVPKQTFPYRCVFWADFYDDMNVTNNAFNTDDLSNVTMQQDKPVDAYEAFYAVTAEMAPDAIKPQLVTLEHAVAKVSVFTTNQIKDCGYAKITCEGGTSFNALTEEASNIRTVTLGATINTSQTATTDNPYLFHYCYFFAPKDKQQLVAVSGTLHKNTTTMDVTRSFKVRNVPLQNNYITNLKGAFGVEAGLSITVNCDADWSKPDNESFAWDGTLPPVNLSYAYSGGAGTEVSPYEIGNLLDLVQFAANSVSAGLDKYFKLTTDIDLADASWPYIHAPTSFDGNGHTIIGLNAHYLDELSDTGFFAINDMNIADIKNLHVEGTVTGGRGNPLGGIVGTGGILGRDDKSSGEIIGCSFKGTVSAMSGSIGGVAGSIGRMTGCKFMGKVICTKGSEKELGNRVGGLVGTGVGRSQSDTGSYPIIACYNTGTIIISGGHIKKVGGVIGWGNVNACYSTGKIEVDGSAQVDNIDDIAGDINTSNTGNPAFANTNFSGNLYFGESSWPSNTGKWAFSPTADGSTLYWKSLGGWNGGVNPEYPKLWWEK